jgi:hypothetical protein
MIHDSAPLINGMKPNLGTTILDAQKTWNF